MGCNPFRSLLPFARLFFGEELPTACPVVVGVGLVVATLGNNRVYSSTGTLP